MTTCDKNRLLSALAEAHGNISTACKATDISRQTHYRWLKEDEEYAEAVSEQSETILDIAERKLLEKVEEGDLRAIMFLLKTKGKERGYDEKRTVSIDHQPISGAPIITFGDTSRQEMRIVTKAEFEASLPKVDLSQLDVDTLRKLRDACIVPDVDVGMALDDAMSEEELKEIGYVDS